MSDACSPPRARLHPRADGGEPRYDRPEESLAPVRAKVIEALTREIEETDAAWAAARTGAGRGGNERAPVQDREPASFAPI